MNFSTFPRTDFKVFLYPMLMSKYRIPNTSCIQMSKFWTMPNFLIKILRLSFARPWLQPEQCVPGMIRSFKATSWICGSFRIQFGWIFKQSSVCNVLPSNDAMKYGKQADLMWSGLWPYSFNSAWFQPYGKSISPNLTLVFMWPVDWFSVFTVNSGASTEMVGSCAYNAIHSAGFRHLGPQLISKYELATLWPVDEIVK